MNFTISIQKKDYIKIILFVLILIIAGKVLFFNNNIQKDQINQLSDNLFSKNNTNKLNLSPDEIYDNMELTKEENCEKLTQQLCEEINEEIENSNYCDSSSDCRYIRACACSDTIYPSLQGWDGYPYLNTKIAKTFNENYEKYREQCEPIPSCGRPIESKYIKCKNKKCTVDYSP